MVLGPSAIQLCLLLVASISTSTQVHSFITPNTRNNVLDRCNFASCSKTTTSSSSSIPRRHMSVSDVEDNSYVPTSSSSVMDKLIQSKSDLIRMCTGDSKPSLNSVCDSVRELEDLAEMAGVGQASSHSGILAGEWELLYSPEDVTRSSPFFWAFERAFPENSDQIFSITDNIPAPIKEVGPAYQTIELDSAAGGSGGTTTGTLVSRVKVATLGGLATSIMTTRCSIVGAVGLDGLRIKVETTKPEESTVLKKLGPLGEAINSNGPPFPSGEALERAMPGSSQVVMVTSYCDEGLRISRNENSMGEPYVWRRKSFGTTDFEI